MNKANTSNQCFQAQAISNLVTPSIDVIGGSTCLLRVPFHLTFSNTIITSLYVYQQMFQVYLKLEDGNAFKAD